MAASVCIRAAARALPPHYVPQERLTEALRSWWGLAPEEEARLVAFHRRVRVAGRHLALPLGRYRELRSFTERNRIFVEAAAALLEEAAARVLAEAQLDPARVEHVLCASTTGISTPSLEGRLMNRMAFRRDAIRTPLFGLGCAAGVGGLARAAGWARARPGAWVLLLAVELCSLTFRWDDRSTANLIATGLFGDASAAVLLGPQSGPQVVASRSLFYPGTEHFMGWEVESEGLRLVLSPEIPRFVREEVARDVRAFLADQGLGPGAVSRWLCHPGGPRVLEALGEALDLPVTALASAWRVLERFGNVSSVTALLLLEEALREPPPPGSWGLLLALGPGFAAELVLLRW